MEEVTCRAEGWQWSDAGNKLSRQKEEWECGAAQLTQISANSLGAVSMSCFKTHLVLPVSQWPASQMVQPSWTQSTTFLQPLGEGFLSFFLLWDPQTRGKNSGVCGRALSVCKSNGSTGDSKWHEIWGTSKLRGTNFAGSTSSQTSHNLLIYKQEHS